MVTIVGVKEVEAQDGKTFTSIELQGEPQLLQSATTGNYYLTANKTRVTTMIPIEVCKMLIGKQLSGTVEKVQVEPYQHINKDTGEVRTLDYGYIYQPEEQKKPEFSMMDFNQPMISHQMPIEQIGISGVITH